MSAAKNLIIIFLSFFFIFSTKADNIRDFQIEGISLGDSLLTHFSRSEIELFQNYKTFTHFNKNKKDFYKIVFLDQRTKKKFSVYQGINFDIKNNDENYIIHGMTAIITTEKIDDCLKEKNIVNLEIEKLLKTPGISFKTNFNNRLGKSVSHQTEFNLESGNIMIWCAEWDYSSKGVNKSWKSDLSITTQTKEYWDWYNSD